MDFIEQQMLTFEGTPLVEQYSKLGSLYQKK